MPIGYKDKKKLLERHKKWIKKKNKIIKKALSESKNKKIKNRSLNELKNLIIKYYNQEKKSDEINKIFFRKMKSKWASCSYKKNMTFNTSLKYLPDPLIRYVVFHEIVHLKEKKHNENFWRLLSKKFKNYEKYERDLLIYWFAIQNQNP